MEFGTRLIQVFQFRLNRNQRKEIYEAVLLEMEAIDVIHELEEIQGLDNALDEAIRNIHPDIFSDEEVEDEEDFIEEDEF